MLPLPVKRTSSPTQHVSEPVLGSSSNPIPVISLFCGAGGLDCGFRQENFKSIFACDNDKAAVNTYNFNTSDKVAILKDLSTAKPKEVISLIEQSALSAAPMGILGGPPCQGFSQGNVYSTLDDPRNILPFKYAKILGALNQKYQLKFFVFENVIGLTNKRHAGRFKKIKKAFSDAGFHIFEKKLNAKLFGVPQSRSRLFLVGLNSDLYSEDDFEFPTGQETTQTVRQALGGLPTPYFFSRGADPQEFPHHPNHWTMAPKSSKFGTIFQGNSRSFRVLSWDLPSPTVAYGHREIHIHPNGMRRLSIYEAMLLQGFPTTYRLLGTLSEQVTQVSNAVPPPVARALAKSIKTALKRAHQYALTSRK